MTDPRVAREIDQRRSRLLFASVAILALCMIVPAFRDIAWVFGIALGLVSVGFVLYLSRVLPRRGRPGSPPDEQRL